MSAENCYSLSGEGAQWSLLPHEVLRLVFKRLSPEDRCNASLVCENWASMFHVAHLWRKRTFEFWGEDKDEGQCAVRYINTVGHHLRHLEIVLGVPYAQRGRKISVSVAHLLAAMPKETRLQSFTLSGLDLFHRIRGIAEHRERIVAALCTFLRAQRCLEEVDLTCELGKSDGVQVLRALTHQCHSTVTSLQVVDLFKWNVTISLFLPFLEEMAKFTALRQVELNFPYCLSEEVLARLAQCNDLKVLSLWVYDFDLWKINPVASAEWTAALSRCPELRVNVNITHSGGSFTLDFLHGLSPGMPLGKFCFGPNVQPDDDIPAEDMPAEDMPADEKLAIFARLAEHFAQHFARTLREFHVHGFDDTSVWREEEAVVGLVKACPSLRCLCLPMTLPLRTIIRVTAASALYPDRSEPLNFNLGGFEGSLSDDEIQALVSTPSV